MEIEVGKIVNFFGDWYQCFEDYNKQSCNNCSFYNGGYKFCTDREIGNCRSENRVDSKSVYFKRLEPKGEPVVSKGRTFQCLKAVRCECTGCVFKGSKCVKDDFMTGTCTDYEVWVEITKEDLKNISSKEKVTDSVSLSKEMKPFSLAEAMKGKPVCTRDGRNATVWTCSLKNKNFPVVAIVSCGQEENVYQYDANGVCDEHDENLDLMMLPEKRSGWIVLRKDTELYNSEEAAKNDCVNDSCVPVRVEFEI